MSILSSINTRILASKPTNLVKTTASDKANETSLLSMIIFTFIICFIILLITIIIYGGNGTNQSGTDIPSHSENQSFFQCVKGYLGL